MADALVVGSKVRSAVKAEGCNMAGDFINALSGEVAVQVKKAAARAKTSKKVPLIYQCAECSKKHHKQYNVRAKKLAQV